MKLFTALLTLACSTVLLYGEFPSVLAERDLEKRSDLALKEAGQMIGVAKKAYDESDFDGFRKKVSEVSELVDLSYKSLLDSGKRARNKPKYWKRAELEIRTLMRRLNTFASYVSVDERDVVTSAAKHISDVHDQVLQEIMRPK